MVKKFDHRDYVIPKLVEIIQNVAPNPKGVRLLDVGAGDGKVTDHLRELGYDVIGMEYSEIATAVAKKSYPTTQYSVGSGYDDLKAKFGEFDLIVSTEVIEHMFTPWVFVEKAFEALRPGGVFIASTPYHGYLKNIMLAVFDKWDFHHDALVVDGHVKFFSRATVEALVRHGGLEPIQFHTGGVSLRWRKRCSSSPENP